MIDIRRIFSTALAMLKQRGLLLVGMLVLLTVLQMIFNAVFGGIVGASMAGAMFGLSDMQDPAVLLSLGGGIVVFALVFYLAIFLFALAQQAAMTALASPLAVPGFGDALGKGFKSAPTLLGTTLLLGFIYFLIALAWVLLATLLSLFGDLGMVANVLVALAVLPLAIYLACRLSVLVPVVAVDGVRNPISAIRRTWEITEGKVLGILVLILAASLIAIALVALPFVLIFVGGAGAANDFAAAGGVTALLGFVLFIPVLVLIGVASAVLSAALHAVIGDSEQQEIEAAFA